MLELANALETAGFTTEGRKLSFDELVAYPKPVVVHFPDHFVVVDAVEGGLVHMMDGFGNLARMEEEAFRQRWSGAVLGVSYAGDPVRWKPQRAAADSGPVPSVRFATAFIDAGEVDSAVGVEEYRFQIRNVGDQELTVRSLHPSCSCMTVLESPTALGPGEAGDILVRYDTTAERGPYQKYIAVYTSFPNFPVARMFLAGYASSGLHVSPETVVLGPIIDGQLAAIVNVRYYEV